MRSKLLLVCLSILGLFGASAQSVSIYRNQDMSYLAERYSVITGDSNANTTCREMRREDVADMAQHIDTLNKVDRYNRQWLLAGNAEYTDSPSYYDNTGRRVFYKNKTAFFGVNKPGINLVLEPIINFSMSGSNYEPERRIFYNKRGFRARGMIGGKVAFQTELADVQERGTHQFDFLRNKYDNTVQGAGFFLPFKRSVDQYGVDYMDTRSTVNFNLLKNYIDLTVGYGKNFVGDGYRSLFLSQNSNNYLYAKLSVNFWKLRYQSITSELMPFNDVGTNVVLPRKYFVNNYLTIDITKNLNLGVFEGVVMSRKDRFDIIYAVPLIFLRAIERNVGSQDNAVMGGSFKWNIKKTAQLYGQLIFDEFRMNDLRDNPKSYVNKYGWQLGAKYFNMFGVSNLDAQIETNFVRPYTYQHSADSVNLRPIESYTHYSQPLAHPLGAGFREFVGILRYQPIPKLMLTLTGIMYKQGVDTSGVNSGVNPLLPYNYAVSKTGVEMVNEPSQTVMYTDIDASYALLPGVSIDASFTMRNQSSTVLADLSDYYFTLGFRMNTFKRKYDY